MRSPELAFVFSGQGAERPDMLDAVRVHHAFAGRYELVCDLLGAAPDVEAQRDPDSVHRNGVSSLVTVLASSIALDTYTDAHGRQAGFLAGYSVGQWTALYAAGCLTFEQLVRIVKQRADDMDACFAGTRGAMMAVIGVSRDRVEQMCRELVAEGHEIFVANYNCAGNYSLSGSDTAIDAALDRVRSLDPKIVARLPMSAAWHCPLLAPAAEAFGRFLGTVELSAPQVPVISNVTGAFLPSDVGPLKTELAQHLTRPVLWDTGIRRLVDEGCRTFVELGFGDTLTKFGFFIDRSVSHTRVFVS